MTEPVSILGLDLGSVRIGVAKSDGLGLMAQPLATLPAKPQAEVVRKIQELIAEYGIQEVVVGHPKKMDGTSGPAAQQAEAFVEILKGQIACPVELWDERLTTAASQRLLIERGMRREARKGVVDQLAAVLILQSYLDVTRSRRSKA